MRRLLSLISQLPPDSALARSRGTSWTNQDEALAFIAEMAADIARSSRDGVQVGMSKGKYRPKFPVKWPRPFDEAPEPMTRESIRSKLLRR